MDEHVYFDETLNEQYYIETNRIRINPLQSVTGTGFSGNFSFDIDISKDNMLLPQETKLYMTFTGLKSTTNNITETALSAPFGVGVAYANANNNRFVGCFSSGGVLNTLSKIHHEIVGAGVVQSVENIPQCQQLLRMSQDNINDASKNSTDPFFIVETGSSIYGDILGTIARQVDSHNFRKHSYLETIIKNAKTQGLITIDNNPKTITLSSSLPLSLFNEQNKFYQGKHIIRCFIDPNWKNNLLMTMYATTRINDANVRDKRFCSYTPAAVNGVNPNFVENTNGAIAIANAISLTVSDVWLEVTQIKVTQRPMGIRSLLISPFNVTINNIPATTSSSNFTISCAPHTHKIIVGFQSSTFTDNLPINTGLNNAEDGNRSLRSGFQTLFNAVDLRDISVRYLDNIYPSTNYDMQFYQETLTTYSRYGADSIESAPVDLPANYAITNQAENARAYNDFIEAMEYTHEDRPMTYNQWLANPIFCFKFLSTTNNASNVDIKLTFRNPTAATINMYVLYYHKGLLTADYRENDVQYSYNYLI